jgi:ribonuclease M5
MTKNLNIQEVIVVEGKTDTQKLQRIFGPETQTIETKGLSLTPEILTLIKKVNAQQGVIIFTDPDGPGKKIRQTLNEALGGKVKNAFITKNDIDKKSRKIGIAEADDEAIHRALDQLITFDQQTISLT